MEETQYDQHKLIEKYKIRQQEMKETHQSDSIQT